MLLTGRAYREISERWMNSVDEAFVVEIKISAIMCRLKYQPKAAHPHEHDITGEYHSTYSS